MLRATRCVSLCLYGRMVEQWLHRSSRFIETDSSVLIAFFLSFLKLFQVFVVSGRRAG